MTKAEQKAIINKLLDLAEIANRNGDKEGLTACIDFIADIIYQDILRNAKEA